MTVSESLDANGLLSALTVETTEKPKINAAQKITKNIFFVFKTITSPSFNIY
jgi:hypothetical protein